jgi:ketosteroid isomerase-like protein
LATVQAIYEAFGNGHVPVIIDQMAEDVEWEQREDNHAQTAGIPSLQARNGKAGVSEYFAVAATMGITDFQVLNLMEGGDQVAATVVIETDLPGGGH